MTAEEIAIRLAATFRENPLAYPGESEVVLGGTYPYLIVWNDHRELTLIIACTDNCHDYNAKVFAEQQAGSLRRFQDSLGVTCSVESYFAHPAATDSTAIMIEEFIWGL